VNDWVLAEVVVGRVDPETLEQLAMTAEELAHGIYEQRLAEEARACEDVIWDAFY
jgi:hypothetical protein